MFSLYFATKYDPSYQNSAPADSDTSFLHAVSEVTISLQMRRWRCKTVTDKSARSKKDEEEKEYGARGAWARGSEGAILPLMVIFTFINQNIEPR